MEPNIFSPLRIVEHTKTFLHLQEPKSRSGFLFIFFRVYPLVMVTAIITVILSFDFPLIIILALAVMVPIFLLLILPKKFIKEVQFSKQYITVTYQTVLGVKIKSLLVNELESIKVETMKFSTTGGYFYRVKPKYETKAYEILTIPRWFMDPQNKLKIDQRLEEITGLEVAEQS